MTILVTGAAGQIGTSLCLKLLNLNHKVIGVDNFITGTRANIKLLSRDKDFFFFKTSIEDPVFKRQLKKFRFDEIYHLACPTGVPNLVRLAEEMLLATSIGTKNILEIARINGSKVLIASSSEVYGDPEIFPQKEEYTGNVSPTGIRSPYEEGKRFTESLAAMYWRKYKLNIKTVRIFNTFGPFMTFDDQRVIPQFLSQAFSSRPIVIYGNGHQERTFLYVDDLLDGFFKVSKKGKPGEIYNVGGTKRYTILQVAKLISKVTKSKSKITFHPKLSHDHRSRLPDVGKIKKLGWKQTIDLEQGLKLLFKDPNFSKNLP